MSGWLDEDKPHRRPPRWLLAGWRWSHRLRAIAALAVLSGVIGGFILAGNRLSSGGPLATGPPTYVFQPTLRGEVITVGTAIVWHGAAEDAVIESIRPRGARDVQVLGFRIMDAGPLAPLTAVSFPPSGSVPLRAYRIRPYNPALIQHNEAAIMVGLRVKPRQRGHVDGLDVVYRAGRSRFRTYLHHEMTLCGYEDVRGECDFDTGP